MRTIKEEREVISQLKSLGDSFDAKQVYKALNLDVKAIKKLKSAHEILISGFNKLNVVGVHLRNRGAGQKSHNLSKVYLEISDAERKFNDARKHIELAIKILE